MRVLFIGGTGTISTACSALLAARGYELTLFNRGVSDRPVPPGAELLRGDIRDRAAAARLLRGRSFDAVVDWVAYTPQHIETDVALFRGRVRQFVLISSASVYRKPARLPVTEDAPVGNPAWAYAADKIACERAALAAAQTDGFPLTIVRPSHTYDERLVPFRGRYTILDRMRRGQPIIVHGDGTSLWTLTHARDFAVGLAGLLANEAALGRVVHLTGDEWLSWNEIAARLAGALGVEPSIVHVPSATIARYDADWGVSLLGDKAHSMIFDNSLARSLVPDFRPATPFADGAREIVDWYAAAATRQQVDPAFDALLDRLAGDQSALGRG